MPAAVRRFGRHIRVTTIARGWMVGRREQLDFQTLMPDLPGLHNFGPANGAPAVPLVPIVPVGTGTPVAQVTIDFLTTLRGLHSNFEANNYPRHGGGAFAGRGLSVDLTLRGAQGRLDERGFY